MALSPFVENNSVYIIQNFKMLQMYNFDYFSNLFKKGKLLKKDMYVWKNYIL